jgi:hypothetical protein
MKGLNISNPRPAAFTNGALCWHCRFTTILFPAALQSFPTLNHKETLMDSYDYVMCGKVYKYSDQHSQNTLKVEVYISFGGLLMKLSGDPSKLQVLSLDSRVFLLMRKL